MRDPTTKTMQLLPVRRATPAEYAAWVRGFMVDGGQVTHHYDYNLPDSFKVAENSFDLPNACGSLAIHVIVPAGQHVKKNGHCSVYNLDGFTQAGGWIPMYNDVAALL